MLVQAVRFKLWWASWVRLKLHHLLWKLERTHADAYDALGEGHWFVRLAGGLVERFREEHILWLKQVMGLRALLSEMTR